MREDVSSYQIAPIVRNQNIRRETGLLKKATPQNASLNDKFNEDCRLLGGGKEKFLPNFQVVKKLNDFIAPLQKGFQNLKISEPGVLVLNRKAKQFNPDASYLSSLDSSKPNSKVALLLKPGFWPDKLKEAGKLDKLTTKYFDPEYAEYLQLAKNTNETELSEKFALIGELQKKMLYTQKTCENALGPWFEQNKYLTFDHSFPAHLALISQASAEHLANKILTNVCPALPDNMSTSFRFDELCKATSLTKSEYVYIRDPVSHNLARILTSQVDPSGQRAFDAYLHPDLISFISGQDKLFSTMVLKAKVLAEHWRSEENWATGGWDSLKKHKFLTKADKALLEKSYTKETVAECVLGLKLKATILSLITTQNNFLASLVAPLVQFDEVTLRKSSHFQVISSLILKTNRFSQENIKVLQEAWTRVENMSETFVYASSIQDNATAKNVSDNLEQELTMIYDEYCAPLVKKEVLGSFNVIFSKADLNWTFRGNRLSNDQKSSIALALLNVANKTTVWEKIAKHRYPSLDTELQLAKLTQEAASLMSELASVPSPILGEVIMNNENKLHPTIQLFCERVLAGYEVTRGSEWVDQALSLL